MILNIVRSISFLVRAADDLGTKTADRQNKMTKMVHKKTGGPDPLTLLAELRLVLQNDCKPQVFKRHILANSSTDATIQRRIAAQLLASLLPLSELHLR